MIPAEVRAALAGRPEVGDWDPMFPLLTVDEAGFPHVCLLSRSELDADDHHVYAVVASRTTVANLRRSPRATLMVVTDEAGVYTKLAVVTTVEQGTWLGLVLLPVTAKRDAIGVPLAPPRYLATASVAADESWERSDRLLAELAHLTKETSTS